MARLAKDKTEHVILSEEYQRVIELTKVKNKLSFNSKYTKMNTMSMARNLRLFSIFNLLIHVLPYGTAADFDQHAVDNVHDDLVLRLLKRVEHLETMDEIRRLENGALRATVQQQNERISALEKRQNVREDVTPYTTEESNVREGLDLTVLNQTDAVFSADPNKRTVKAQLKQRPTRQIEIGNVAFYAVVDTHHLQNLGANQRLEFDRVVTNLGNAYHESLGVFISPAAGTYVFSTTLMGITHDNAHYYISLNGHAVANMYIHGQDSYLASSSRTVVLSLQKGDEVSIRNMNVTEGVFGYQFSSFSGFLLSLNSTFGSIIG